MKYMLLMYGKENDWTEDERRACMVESLEVYGRLAAEGKTLDTSPLQSVSTARTVRVRDGRVLVTDGPFAETTEQLGGYFVLDLADLDEAIAVASRLPPVRKGTVEIRPLLPLEGLPEGRPATSAPGGEGLTPFMFLCYHDEADLSAAGPEAVRTAMAEAVALCREMHESGRYLSSSPLRSRATATCVRVRDGKRLLTDGPFAETHEIVGGFYVLLAASADEAVAIAARQPGARHGAVEVRPLFDLSGLHAGA